MSHDKSEKIVNNQPGNPVVENDKQQQQQPTEFGKEPIFTTCPKCKENIETVVTINTGENAWLWSGILCAIWPCWLCVPIPLCMKRLKDAIHKCPKCGAVVGKFKGKFNYMCCNTYNN